MKLTSEEFQKIKEALLIRTSSIIKSEGFLNPIVTIVAVSRKDNSWNHYDIALPPETEDDPASLVRGVFMDVVLPGIASDISIRDKIMAVAVTAEAWVRSAKIDQVPKDWRQLHIQKEVVFILLETAGKSENLVYNIKRSQSVDADKGLVEHVDLSVATEISGGEIGGNLSGIFKKIVR